MHGFIEIGGRMWPAPVWLVKRIMRRWRREHGAELQYDENTRIATMDRP